MWPVEQTKLIDIYDPKMPTGINAPWVQVYKNQMSEAQLAGYARLLHAQLIIEELVRLGILTRRQRAEARDHFLLNDIPYADERQSYRSSSRIFFDTIRCEFHSCCNCSNIGNLDLYNKPRHPGANERLFVPCAV
jgi:hypothetical protein